jgi:hypothetical protein
MKDAAGGDFTITPCCASQLMDVSGTVSPLRTHRPCQIISALTAAELPPARLAAFASERHNPNSIATLRMAIARLLLRQLPYCPFCGSHSG